MIIVDGNNIGARSFFATHYKKTQFSPFVFSSAFVKSLLNVIRLAMLRHENNMVVLCMDSKSWRYEIYPDYKGDRDEDGGNHNDLYYEYLDLYEDMCADIKRMLPIRVWKRENYEADDLMAWLATRTGKHVIASGDADMQQCINENVEVLDVGKDMFRTLGNTDPKYALHEAICLGGHDNIKSIVPRNEKNKPAYKLGEITLKAMYDPTQELCLKKEFREKVSKGHWEQMMDTYVLNSHLVDLSKSRIFKEVFDWGLKPSYFDGDKVDHFMRAYAGQHWSRFSEEVTAMLRLLH